MQALGVDADNALGHGALVRVNLLRVHGDDVLALVVVDEVEVLQGGHHVFLLDRCLLRNLTAKTRSN